MVEYLDIKFSIHKFKRKILHNMKNMKGIWFHLAGILCLIWFLIRVLPKPDRIRYPCQQLALGLAVGYITFWGILWSGVFLGLRLWVKRMRYKTTAYLPVLLVACILIFSVTSNVYADIFINKKEKAEIWTPTSKDPIGVPTGANPGRVVWVWDPNATEEELTSYWWYAENNNQYVLDNMVSYGLQSLAGTEDDSEAWDFLFKYFNEQHEKGNISYQTGEKITIKINLNNCWRTGGLIDYIFEDNERDASPYVIKSLLKQLIDVVGVNQSDITIFDASRPMANWFYNRLYYEYYPDSTLIPEFPDVNYVDSMGRASGREKAIASDVRIYLAEGTCEYRTLPTVVTEADYLINMPIMKRHPIQNGVTLSGKNFFGTFIEAVYEVHPYHQSGLIMGNPTIQTDLLSHEHLGGKTILYLGDGIFSTKIDHATIAKFDMYPFNGDWTNSLFFSQDPVAIDSVMYDFLYTEGTNPIEGSQNYLHQSAEPLLNEYDPEGDGEYLDHSLGVHEHWDTSVNIFSFERYIGIDFMAVPITDNSPPDSPTITGEVNGKPNTEYEYKFVSTDPEGDNITYCIKWGDDTEEIWIGPYSSGIEASATHSWSEKGNYIIKVKAIDDYGTESNWATLSVSMPKNKLSNMILFKIFESLFSRFTFMVNLAY
jgi:hypothetical protein